jgi:anti-sigma regulatory factor (Ser/Thr protein kinase)
MQAQPESRICFDIEPALRALAPASEKVRLFLDSHGVDKDAIFAIEMVIEEIATNTIKYAFCNREKGAITIEASANATRAELIMEDSGDAFDPTGAPDPDVNRALEDMPVGGLGIHLIRELTDGFEYQRLNGRNRVHVWVERKT